jgi:hypothetical protein
MSDEGSDVIRLAREVGAALAEHARACADDGPPEAVTQAGEAAVEALLAYERLLGERTGWSNPLRHLGSLPAYSGPVSDRLATDGTIVGAAVVTYQLVVPDAVGLGHLVEGRGGDPPTGVADALEALIREDGWDPALYPSGLVELREVSIEVSVDRDPRRT